MEIGADFRKLQTLIGELEQFQRKVRDISQSTNSIRLNLDWQLVNSDQEIDERLKRIRYELEAMSTCFQEHAKYLVEVQDVYRRLEQELINDAEDRRGRVRPEITTLPDLSGISPLKLSFGDLLDRKSIVIEPWLEKAIASDYKLENNILDIDT